MRVILSLFDVRTSWFLRLVVFGSGFRKFGNKPNCRGRKSDIPRTQLRGSLLQKPSSLSILFINLKPSSKAKLFLEHPAVDCLTHRRKTLYTLETQHLKIESLLVRRETTQNP